MAPQITRSPALGLILVVKEQIILVLRVGVWCWGFWRNLVSVEIEILKKVCCLRSLEVVLPMSLIKLTKCPVQFDLINSIYKS